MVLARCSILCRQTGLLPLWSGEHRFILDCHFQIWKLTGSRSRGMEGPEQAECRRPSAKRFHLVRRKGDGTAEEIQASDAGSIPIGRSRNPVDAVGFTGFPPRNRPPKLAILDAVGRGILVSRSFWTRLFSAALFLSSMLRRTVGDGLGRWSPPPFFSFAAAFFKEADFALPVSFRERRITNAADRFVENGSFFNGIVARYFSCLFASGKCAFNQHPGASHSSSHRSTERDLGSNVYEIRQFRDPDSFSFSAD
jgi:hypothetical protein